MRGRKVDAEKIKTLITELQICANDFVQIIPTLGEVDLEKNIDGIEYANTQETIEKLKQHVECGDRMVNITDPKISLIANTEFSSLDELERLLRTVTYTRKSFESLWNELSIVLMNDNENVDEYGSRVLKLYNDLIDCNEGDNDGFGSMIYQAALASAFNDLLLTFVNTVDLCYKLKLILEQFGVPTCVLNSEVPASSRSRAVTQFNTGTYDVIIASDEQVLEESHKINQKSKRKKKKEPGVARGIDF
ncbi:ATP-dependent RNA helicase DBP9-like [Aphidius gifuensis]|uniref:ATP-dependent RNA helicase DBP9-like n=1 Tax=Aphidius gifuensis TaxID=684658 RepID=UPI001CDBD066|nr:ATP-dependent RNA helicase DBP9-like [Aphidius gifuensis]